MTHASRIDIDLGAIEHNTLALRSLAGPGQTPPALCAALKKNAYGLGVVPIAHRLMRLGVQMLAVYSDDEAAELVSKAITLPILVLSPLHTVDRTDVLYRHLIADRLHLSIHDLDQLKAVSELGHRFGLRVPIQPYIDTGMSRSGLSPGQFHEMMNRLADYPFVRISGVYTHMATADDRPEFTEAQFERFTAAVEQEQSRLPQGVTLHAANTFTCFRDRRYHLDMIRPGLGIYGYGPEWLQPGSTIDDAPTLRPALRWLSQLTHIQRYPSGTPVGYGSTHTLERDSVIGIVPVGYADGYPVALSNLGVVRIKPTLDTDATLCDCRVLGRVSMDQITVDLTDLVGQHDVGNLMGAEVEIYSSDPAAPNAPSRLARMIGTHTYELLTRLSQSITRHCVG